MRRSVPRKKDPNDGQPSLFDLQRAKAERDAGIELTAEANYDFMFEATAVIEEIAAGERVTGETIRKRCEEYGIRPKTPKTWGALTMHAISRGLLARTGKYVTPRDVKSHACKKPLYVRTSV